MPGTWPRSRPERPSSTNLQRIRTLQFGSTPSRHFRWSPFPGPFRPGESRSTKLTQSIPVHRAVILCVERDPHVRDLESYFLTEAGFQVTFAADGIEALELARTLRPAIVITEILVPKLDGLALCRRLKADEATKGTAVLVFSLLAAEGRAQRRRRRCLSREAALGAASHRHGTQAARRSTLHPGRHTMSPTAPSADPTPRISSGNREADRVLGGGFPSNSINILMGEPGTGKTLFAEQLLFANANGERPVLYLTTLSEPLSKVVTYLQLLPFYDESKLGTAVMYDDIGGLLATAGVSALVPRVREAILEFKPSIIVIDSFKAIHDLSPSVPDMRRLISELAGLLSAYDTTTFLVGEYREEDISCISRIRGGRWDRGVRPAQAFDS